MAKSTEQVTELVDTTLITVKVLKDFSGNINNVEYTGKAGKEIQLDETAFVAYEKIGLVSR